MRTLRNAVDAGQGPPRLPLRRLARHRQDVDGEDPRGVPELRGSGRSGRRSSRAASATRASRSRRATSLDVIEMDAASNNSVDDIRDLRESVVYAPVSGRHKVYILDEAHMLSTQAWNAFLKTLEEPPPNTVFVLATTEAAKVLPTVVDRCHRFDFARPTVEQLASVVRRVARRSSRSRSRRTRSRCSRATRRARFATRWARSSSSSRTRARQIATEDVLAVLGVADADLLFAALDAIAASDPRARAARRGPADRHGARRARLRPRPRGARARPHDRPDARRGAGGARDHPRARRAPGRSRPAASARPRSRGCSTCWPRRWRRRRTARTRAPSSSSRS